MHPCRAISEVICGNRDQTEIALKRSPLHVRFSQLALHHPCPYQNIRAYNHLSVRSPVRYQKPKARPLALERLFADQSKLNSPPLRGSAPRGVLSHRSILHRQNGKTGQAERPARHDRHQRCENPKPPDGPVAAPIGPRPPIGACLVLLDHARAFGHESQTAQPPQRLKTLQRVLHEQYHAHALAPHLRAICREIRVKRTVPAWNMANNLPLQIQKCFHHR